MTYGSCDAMGEATKLFTLEEKLRYHPDLLQLAERKEMLNAASKSLAKSMRSELADMIDEYGDKFGVQKAYNRARNIRGDDIDLSTPFVTIGYVSNVVERLEKILPSLGGKVNEEETEDAILDFSALLGGLVRIRTSTEKNSKKDTWDAKIATRMLSDIYKRFKRALKMDIFCEEKARALCDKIGQAQEEYRALYSRIEEEVPKQARLHMCTIGSSHKLPVSKKPDLAGAFGLMSFNECDDFEEEDLPKKTVVIFDEAGCIPSYELVGISRLGLDIEALVLVGDKHQLPPYDANQGRPSSQRLWGRYRQPKARVQKVQSLLDASALKLDTGKVMLTTQYRVPKDIADMLNVRVYNGKYKTCPNAGVPHFGLTVIDVPEDLNPRRKYVNSREVERGLKLADRLLLDDSISSVLIITPYKNQQREFQFQMKRINMECPVLTIDQCQGQEADAVILSLVRKPTRFLNKNRLNVALSRVRKKLYVLVDRDSLRDACRNTKWETALMAADLLDK